jgi:hypothetical protein
MNKLLLSSLLRAEYHMFETHNISKDVPMIPNTPTPNSQHLINNYSADREALRMHLQRDAMRPTCIASIVQLKPGVLKCPRPHRREQKLRNTSHPVASHHHLASK